MLRLFGLSAQRVAVTCTLVDVASTRSFICCPDDVAAESVSSVDITRQADIATTAPTATSATEASR